jgi:hypothetical protein
MPFGMTRVKIVMACAAAVVLPAAMARTLGSSESAQPAAKTTPVKRANPAAPCRFDTDGNYADPKACWAWRDKQPLELAVPPKPEEPYDGLCAESMDDEEDDFLRCLEHYEDVVDTDGGYPDGDPYQDRMP